jgi:hypothetical protein
MQLSAAAAKLLIYQAFIEEEAGFPKHPARRVHDLYFVPCMRSSSHEPCGACRTPSPVHLRSWSRSRSTKPQRSWRWFLQVVRPS